MHSAMSKGFAAFAVVATLPFFTVQAFADTSFNSQYQANLSQEQSLLQTAESSSFSDSYTASLSSTVQTINNEVSTLYSAEQALVAQEANMAQVNQQDVSAQLTKLEEQRYAILHQSQMAWNIVNFWFGRRHGNPHDDDMFGRAKMKWEGIGQQLKSINQQINQLKHAEDRRSRPYNGGLTDLQNSILRLQQSAIYYTKEWIAAEQGNGSTGTVSLPAPSISVTDNNGVYSVNVGGAVSGATAILYNTAGQEVAAQVVASNGTTVFGNVGSGSYYVVETQNGVTSPHSNVVVVNTVLPTPVISPSESGGYSQITVTNGVSGATVTLYNSNGAAVRSVGVDSNGRATFDQVSPGAYYVVEYGNGGQSARSNTLSISNSLSTPDIAVTNTNGQYNINVSNVVPGSVITLYNSTNGQSVGAVVANSSGSGSFSNVGAGNYDVIESYNGAQSGQSSIVTVP